MKNFNTDYTLSDISELLAYPKNSIYVFSSNIANVTQTKERTQAKTLNQSKHIRALLQQVLTDLNINDVLNESTFPYQLTNTKGLVSFSHSGNSENINLVGVIVFPLNPKLNTNTNTKIISKFGIDTEIRQISSKVVSRFFAKPEQDFLKQLYLTNLKSFSTTSQLMWMAKEAYIKTNNLNLVQGIGTNLAELFELIDLLNCKQEVTILKKETSTQFIWLPKHQAMACFLIP